MPPAPGEEGALAYVKMSGIPNTHVAVGQTTSLVAIAYDQHGTPIQNAKVEWKSSNPSVARIDAFGNIQTVVMLLVHPPEMVDGTQNREQGGGAGKHHLVPHGIGQHVWCLCHHCLKGAFHRNKEQHEVQTARPHFNIQMVALVWLGATRFT